MILCNMSSTSFHYNRFLVAQSQQSMGDLGVFNTRLLLRGSVVSASHIF